MTLKKSNLGIHDASKHLNREVGSQLDQIIFDLGIHSVDKNISGLLRILCSQPNIFVCSLFSLHLLFPRLRFMSDNLFLFIHS